MGWRLSAGQVDRNGRGLGLWLADTEWEIEKRRLAASGSERATCVQRVEVVLVL
jgi:hypothetical protein